MLADKEREALNREQLAAPMIRSTSVSQQPEPAALVVMRPQVLARMFVARCIIHLVICDYMQREIPRGAPWLDANMFVVVDSQAIANPATRPGTCSRGAPSTLAEKRRENKYQASRTEWRSCKRAVRYLGCENSKQSSLSHGRFAWDT